MTNPASPSTAKFTRLTDSQLLLIKGPDAGKFLQGQVTCDIKELVEPVTRIGAQCNPKGRVLLSFRAMQMNSETIALRIPASMAESAQKSLGKYIVFAKAKLHPSADDYQLFGLYGENATTVAATFFPHLPATVDAWVEQQGCYLIQLAEDRFECWIAESALDNFLALMKKQTLPSHCDEWQLLNIAAGIGEVYPETYELFTPQELNFQLTNGINFRKGCYTGQEIVARLHYRGKLKRHMYRFEYQEHLAPLPGTPVINAATGQAIGNVVMATPARQGKIELLASLLDEQIENALVEHGTEKLHQLSLPYAIPTAEDAPQ